MNAAAQGVFWFCAAALFYVYVGYPLVLFIVSSFVSKKVGKREFEPTVTMIIAAFNEENDIGRKLENTLNLDYPPEKLEVIVASDCSTDGTDEIVSSFRDKGVVLVRQLERRGKTSAQNLAVESASGEILLFSDATTEYDARVLRELVPNFADPTVGCVAGRLIYQDGDSTMIGGGTKGYWNYETFVKRMEGQVCSLIGVSGCLYAVKRSAYRAMYEEACSDFLISTILYRQGLRTVFEPAATCVEEAYGSPQSEFEMRVRVISQTFNDLWRNRDILNPFRGGFFAYELISHKLLRYLVPIFLLGMLISSGFLAFESRFFILVLSLQVTLYILAAFGYYSERAGIKIRLLTFPLYFVLTNGASVLALWHFLRGKRYAKWEPVRGGTGSA